MTKLGDFVAEAESGFACGEEDPAGIFQFRMNNVTSDSQLNLDKRRRVPPDAHRQIGRFLVRPDDVLFNATNSPDNVGKSVLVPHLDEPAVFSNHFVRLRVDPGRLNASFLWRWLQWTYQRGVFRSMCRQWVNQATVSRESLLGLTVRFPSLEDQRRIATSLNAADSVRAMRRQVLVETDGLPEAVFFEMFGDPLDNPHGWRRIRLDQVVTSIASGESPVCEARPAADHEWGVLKLGAVSYGRFKADENKAFLGDLASIRRVEVKPGDILFSRKNTKELVGATVVVSDVPPRRLLPDLIFRLHLADGEIDANYLKGLLTNHRKRPQVVALASGSASSMSNISQARLMGLQVEVPPISHQRAYALRIRAISELRSRNERSLTELNGLFGCLQARAFSSGQ